MLKVIINGTYYEWQDYWVFNFKKGRWKYNSVFFFDYSDEIWFIIHSLSDEQLKKLRLAIYNSVHHLVKFTKFVEKNVRWEVFEWYKITSPIIDITDNEFAQIIPDKLIRKKYFVWDNIKERYSLKSDFINYVRLKNV